jgi:magnesium-protoporphyrin IX monomethyl ester (oxidative) cyclase
MVKEFHRVLLITPPYIANGISPHPQMGLAYIAAFLEENGFQVGILDAMAEGWEKSGSNGWDGGYIGLSENEIRGKISAFSPDAVGVHNNFTSQYRMPHLIFKIVKEVNPRIVTMTGGAHATVCPGECLSDPNLDYVILGEGEVPTLNLMRYLNGEIQISDCEGIAFRNNAHEISTIPQGKKIENLDSLPFPALHLLNMDLYWKLGYSHGLRRGTRFAPVITSRGCPFSCSFCSYHCVNGKKFRGRSPENVIREVKTLVEKYGVDEITFEDDNILLDRKRAELIFDSMIQENLSIKWEIPNGVAVYTLTKPILKKMKASGCYRINFAIESGNQYVLDKIIKKPVKLESVPELIQYAREIGLEVQAFFVIGTPSETKEQIWDTFTFSKKIGVYHPFISFCMPLVGSEAYTICRSNNFFDRGYSIAQLNLRYPCFSTPQISSKDLFRLKFEGERYLLLAELKENPFKLRTLGELIKKQVSFLIRHGG